MRHPQPIAFQPDQTPSHSEALRATAYPARVAAVVALVLGAAIFGFFYAWVCSTTWGLDLADPRVAIEAMQEMNASVRNPVFFVSFFLTPAAWGIAALLAWQGGLKRAGLLLALAGAIYLFCGLLLTATINVPLNEELGRTAIPADLDEARQIWTTYSQTWQGWNLTRTIASGISFVVGVLGFGELMRRIPA